MIDLMDFKDFAAKHHPFDSLKSEAVSELAALFKQRTVKAGVSLYEVGDTIPEFALIAAGSVDLVSAEGLLISQLREGDYFGAISILRNGPAIHRVITATDVTLFELPAAAFIALLKREPSLDTFYNRRAYAASPAVASAAGQGGFMTLPISEIMTRSPVTIAPQMSLKIAAKFMVERHISCVLVAQNEGEKTRLKGILTSRDLARLVAGDAAVEQPVSMVMTPEPITLSPSNSGFDALLAMSERRIGHLPIVENDHLVGIVTQTDLLRRHTNSTIHIIRDITEANSQDSFAPLLSGLPQVFSQLVGSGASAYQVGQMMTSITDALTRRLLTLAEDKLGVPPVPYLWLACGSQGRQEQTGVSDQDNCLMLHEDFVPEAHDSYFAELARFVCDGLAMAGYVYCPGDMMATNPRWRQPVNVWRSYFDKWVRVPDPMAQMLASVMFDLRPISGLTDLFTGMQRETLTAASKNSIFQAHMTANSLKHTPPLSLFRGFALISNGEHKNHIDLKHSGVVPIVDIGRLYALKGKIEAVNTLQRLTKARDLGVVSPSGGSDLIDAFDLISTVRLRHQAKLIKNGQPADNFMAPAALSALERNHLRDAFSVVKSLQSSLGYGRVNQ